MHIENAKKFYYNLKRVVELDQGEHEFYKEENVVLNFEEDLTKMTNLINARLNIN